MSRNAHLLGLKISRPYPMGEIHGRWLQCVRNRSGTILFVLLAGEQEQNVRRIIEELERLRATDAGALPRGETP